MAKKPLRKAEEPKPSAVGEVVNSNSIHNFLNVAISVISVWALFDWSQFGIPQPLALKIIGMCGLLKLTMNAMRDGLKGMIEPQPPVSN